LLSPGFANGVGSSNRVPKWSSQPSHGNENRECVQRRGRSISGQSSLRIFGFPPAPGSGHPTASEQKCTSERTANPALSCRCCPTETRCFRSSCFSSREGRLRVARHFSAGYRFPLGRVPEGRLKRLARALLDASRRFAGVAVPYPWSHGVLPFKRPSGTRRHSIANPALKCRATFNRPYRDEERPRLPDVLWDGCE